jgi:endonuclease YncB( thermonuclease family)
MARRKETVTRVIDGDTFLTASRKRSVRLADVNAPEKDTKRGTKATRQLRQMIQGEKVRVYTKARDVYGRAVAEVKHGRESVNKEMRKKIKSL